jgi:2'-5' RNA ligase
MDYAVMVYFEEAAEQKIGSWIRGLTELGLNDRFSSIGMKPHLTLAEFDIADMGRLEQILEKFARENAPVNLKFSSLGIFPGNDAVVFLSPVASKELVELHTSINQSIESCCDRFSPLYTEDSWVAHCTLALDYKPHEISRAYDYLEKNFNTVETKAVSLVLYGCCPYHEMSVFRFKNEP